ncbi:hypothetical protein, partial [Gilvimarinus sp. 1_MG-2023]
VTLRAAQKPREITIKSGIFTLHTCPENIHFNDTLFMMSINSSSTPEHTGPFSEITYTALKNAVKRLTDFINQGPEL